MAYHRLPPEDLIAPAFEKGPGGERGVGGKVFDRTSGLQGAAQGGGHPAALVILVDIQPVQIARTVHVRKTQDFSVLLRHQGVVGQKGGVQASKSTCPSAQASNCSGV